MQIPLGDMRRHFAAQDRLPPPVPVDLRGYEPMIGDYLEFGSSRGNGTQHKKVEEQWLLNPNRLKPLRHDEAYGVIDQCGWATIERLWEARWKTPRKGVQGRYVYNYVHDSNGSA